jgi:Flp pilus assembly protein TadD
MASAFGQLPGVDVNARAEALSEKARQMFEAGDYQSAAGQYRAAMRAAPQDKVYPYALGMALAAAGDATGAKEAYRMSITLAPLWSAPALALTKLLRDPAQTAPVEGGGTMQALSVAPGIKKQLLSKYNF